MKYKNHSSFKSYSNVTSINHDALDTILRDHNVSGVDVSDLYKKEVFILKECILKKEKEVIDLQNDQKELQKNIDQLNKDLEIAKVKISESERCKLIFDKLSSSLKQIIPELSFAIANKIARGALQDNYINIIKNVLNEGVPLLKNSLLNIKIELNPEAIVAIEKTIKEEYQFTNFEIIHNAEMEICDCKVSWDYGCIESITSDIVNKILSVIK